MNERAFCCFESTRDSCFWEGCEGLGVHWSRVTKCSHVITHCENIRLSILGSSPQNHGVFFCPDGLRKHLAFFGCLSHFCLQGANKNMLRGFDCGFIGYKLLGVLERVRPASTKYFQPQLGDPVSTLCAPDFLGCIQPVEIAVP